MTYPYLLLLVQIQLAIAAVTTTSFPLLYLFSPWRHSPLGRVVMIQGIAFALAIDMTLLFQFWAPHSIAIEFAINSLVFGGVSMSTSMLTGMLWNYNFRKRNQTKEISTNDDRTPARSERTGQQGSSSDGPHVSPPQEAGTRGASRGSGSVHDDRNDLGRTS